MMDASPDVKPTSQWKTICCYSSGGDGGVRVCVCVCVLLD